MTFLLDTHVLIWWLLADRRLSRKARELVGDPSNRILISSASAWEIATKHRLGKLTGVDALVRDMAGWVERAGFEELPITIVHAQRAGAFPQTHRDPFDRMLVAQSEREDAPIVTSDSAFEAFGARMIW
jgi:PIN domain nuclease of toxin-antitoxin system